jgi:hypothetical protein
MMPVPHGIYSSCTRLACIFFPFVYILNFYFPFSYFLPLYLFPLFLSPFPSFLYSSFLKIFHNMFGGRGISEYAPLPSTRQNCHGVSSTLCSHYPITVHASFPIFCPGKGNVSGCADPSIACLHVCSPDKTCFWTLSEIHSVHRVFLS